MCYDERKVKKVTIVGLRTDIAMETGYQKNFTHFRGVVGGGRVGRKMDEITSLNGKFITP